MTFLPAVNYSVGDFPEAVSVGDFNHDGKLDLVEVNSGNDNVGIMLGNGDGTFKAPANFKVGYYPDALAVGDFDRDGKLDLVVANVDNVSVLLGKGDGSFQAAVSYPAGRNPQGGRCRRPEWRWQSGLRHADIQTT